LAKLLERRSPTEIMAMDILDPFQRVRQKAVTSWWLITIYEWMEAFPILSQEAGTIATKLVDEVFMQFGVLTQLHSDQGQ